ncbi:hypothetical protein FPV67DRAFT_602713 [Lyophyllum atratum]|nr:hypothetical protein FPV67DRAFT_602713 [Lyophyllum atratum]
MELHHMLLPFLYGTLDLRTNKSCKDTLKALKSRPDLTQFTRELIVRLNRPPRWINCQIEDPIDESWVAAVIELIALAGGLKALRKFRWEGEQALTDSLWLTLQRCCASLRDVGTTIGSEVEETSNLFAFRDLVGFSLTLEPHTGPWRSAEMSALPDRLWNILIIGSPDLKELTIDGGHLGRSNIDGSYHGRPTWDIRKLLSGRWPKLQLLATGNFSNHFDHASQLPLDIPDFLARHSALEGLSLSPRMLNIHEFAAYSSAVLPHLRTFSGVRRQMAQASLSSPQNLTLTSYVESTPEDFGALGFLPSLLSLRIELRFLNFLRDPLETAACSLSVSNLPKLRHLQLTTNRPIALGDLSAGLRQSHNLLSCSVAGFITDKQLNQGAILVAKENPKLQDLAIRDFLQWEMGGKASVRRIRSYIIERDYTSAPRRLIITQKGHIVKKHLHFQPGRSVIDLPGSKLNI